jgi:hypothetical protein
MSKLQEFKVPLLTAMYFDKEMISFPKQTESIVHIIIYYTQGLSPFPVLPFSRFFFRFPVPAVFGEKTGNSLFFIIYKPVKS